MKTFYNLTAMDFVAQLTSDQNAVIIDVRSIKEFEEDHIPGAINIPVTNKEELLKLDKGKSYYLYCRVGGRSAMACQTLIAGGFGNIKNLNGTFEEFKRLYTVLK